MNDSNSLPAGRVFLELDFGPEKLSWTAREKIEANRPGVRFIYQKALEHGEAHLRRKKTIQEDTAGTRGEVLPRGRLPALMRYVREPDQMSLLCWSVLRRYAAHHRCGLEPRRSIRIQAYQAISRAWERVSVDKGIRYLPTGFWKGELPCPEIDLWLLVQSLTLSLKNERVEAYLGWPAYELLDPAAMLEDKIHLYLCFSNRPLSHRPHI